MFSFRVTAHLLFSFLLQQTLESAFLPRSESLKLNQDTHYLMLPEDTVLDALMGVQFNIKSKSSFSIRVKVHLLFSFYCKRRLNLYLYHAMNL